MTDEIAKGFGVVEEYGREGVAIPRALHPLGPAVAEDADISEDALETVEVEIPESFADHPISLAEVRSDKTENAADWTPRDALIWLLRKIDSGELNPTTVVVMYGERVDDLAKSSYVIASPHVFDTLGVIARETFKLHSLIEAHD